MECECFEKYLKGEATDEYAISVPNDKALKGIAKHGPIIEVGAGSGYWAWLLAIRGCQIAAYDPKPWKKVFFPIVEGDFREGLAKYPHWSLLIAWEWTTLDEILKYYRGSKFINVGVKKTIPGWKEKEEYVLPKGHWVTVYDRVKGL